MGQKVLGFENKIKFHHILARIFFSPIHISKLLYWLVILGKTSKRLNTQSAGPSEPRGQLLPPDFGRNRSKTLSINMPWITNHSPFPIFRPSNGPALSQLGPFMRAMPDRRTWQGRMVWVLTKSSTNHVFICGPL